MEQLKWSTGMELGIPEIDKVHHDFLEKLSEIANAPDSKLHDLLFAFISGLEEDFKKEEELMESLDYYDIKPHRAQHAKVLGALHQVVPDVLRGEYESTRKALNLLPKWFLFHLSTMDKLLAIWFSLKNSDALLESNWESTGYSSTYSLSPFKKQPEFHDSGYQR